jgi:chromosome segregation ATPase
VSSVECQTSATEQIQKYEALLRAEATANEELAETVQRLERELHTVRADKERAVKEKRQVSDQLLKLEITVAGMQEASTKMKEQLNES